MSVKERFIFYLSSKFKRSLLYIAILSATIDVLQFIKKILKSDKKKIVSKNKIQTVLVTLCPGHTFTDHLAGSTTD